MRIVAYTQRESGVGYHRLFMPLAHMQDVKVHVTNLPTLESFNFNPDVIVYNRVTFFQDWNAYRAESSAKIVMDIDDGWILPTNHINYPQYQFFRPIIENNLRNADCVTVTHERLAEQVWPFNQNIHILPNALPYGRDQFVPDRVPDDKFRIFWAGSVTHNHDLAILRDPIKRLLPLADRVKFVMGGYVDSDPVSKQYWDGMLNSFTACRAMPHARIHATLPEDYYGMFAYADAMVVPLEDSPWHGLKSNLKLLEAAGKSIPVVCSHVAPYTYDADAPVLWAKNKADWFSHMKSLILDKSKRDEYGQALHTWATERYNFDIINAERRELYRTLCGAPTSDGIVYENGGDDNGA